MNKNLLLSLIAGFCMSANANEFQYKKAGVEISNINQTAIHLMSPIKIHNDELIVPIDSGKLLKKSQNDHILWKRIKSYYINDKVIETQNSKSIGEFILSDLPLVNLDKNKSDNFKRVLLNEFSFMGNSEKSMFGLNNFHGNIIINRYMIHENSQKIMVNKIVLFYPDGIKFITFISNDENTNFLIIAPNNTNFEHMKSNIDKIIQYVKK